MMKQLHFLQIRNIFSIPTMISFQTIDNFNNIATPFNFSVPMQRSLISPLGNYLLRYDTTAIYLYDLKQKSQIPIKINSTIRKAVFSLDQNSIIFTNKVSISSYSLINKTISQVIPERPYNNSISDFEFNHNYSYMYYINQSYLYQLDFSTYKIRINATNSNQCNPIQLTYDQNTNTIITSTFVNGQNICFICKWNINSNNFAYSQSQNITNCLINDIYIFGDKIALTKRKLNTNQANTILLDYSSLTQYYRTSEPVNNNNGAFIVPYHNYYIQYFSFSNIIYIYKDDLTTTPFTYQYPNVRSIQFNPYNECFYIVAIDKNLATIKTLVPLFNCSQAEGAILSANEYDTDCSCPPGQLFNKQSFSCQNTTCQCPQGQTCNRFNLRCQLNCSIISNTLPIISYDNSKCLCASPFAWNQQFRDCSRINCRQIQYSQSEDVLNDCKCISGYQWDEDFNICRFNNISSQIFEKRTSQSNTKSSVGLICAIVIVILFLIFAAFLYYYKKCRNTTKQKQDDEKVEGEQGPTDRQMAEKKKSVLTPDILSNEHLQHQEKQKDENEDIENFSIADDQQKENDKNFEEIKSNMQNPLVL